MVARYVIDCGSRSIKLHLASAGTVRLLAMRSWDPLINAGDGERIGALLADLATTLPASSVVQVVGTAAARRSPALASAIATACRRFGWSYRTLSHPMEAGLILEACGRRPGCDIVNAGGGSIQIVRPEGECMLLAFGISDLNARFGLGQEPALRRPALATEFVYARLSSMSASFLYSGGELAYLHSVGARVDGDGRCTASEFHRVAAKVDAMDLEALERLSPFDPGWLRGAVASNAIVRACLARSGAGHYFASDINIGEGMLAALTRRVEDATGAGV